MSALAGLNNLNFLQLGENQIVDITGLSATFAIDLSGNQILDLSPLLPLALLNLDIRDNSFSCVEQADNIATLDASTDSLRLNGGRGPEAGA